MARIRERAPKGGFQGALDLFILFDAFVKTNSYSKICYIIYHIWRFVNVIFHISELSSKL